MKGAFFGPRATGASGARRGRAIALFVVALPLLSCEAGAVNPAEPPPASAPSGRDSSRQRVIAKLRLEGGEGGGTAAGDAPSNAARIAAARERLVASLPANEVRVTRAFASIPFVALEVSPAGLAALRASPLVAGIEEDRVQSIQGAGGSGGDPGDGPAR